MNAERTGASVPTVNRVPGASARSGRARRRIGGMRCWARSRWTSQNTGFGAHAWLDVEGGDAVVAPYRELLRLPPRV